MTPIRTLIAGVVGGIVLFIWGAVSHMVLQVGDMGAKDLPGEGAIVPAIVEHVTEPGLYFFPGYGSDKQTPEADALWQQKVAAGPNGILVVQPGPGPEQVMSPAQLAIEWASGTLAALIVAVVLSRLPCAVLVKAALACGIGIAGWLAIDVSYWNWYRFPGAMILGELIDQGVGWLLAGLVMAPIVGRAAPRAAVPPAGAAS